MQHLVGEQGRQGPQKARGKKEGRQAGARFRLTLQPLSQQTEGFRKRWFTMDDRRLLYFKDPLVRMGPAPRGVGGWMPPHPRPRPGGCWPPGWGGCTGGRALSPGCGPPGPEAQPGPNPQDAFARGEVFIGSRESGYTVLDGLPPSTQGHHWPHGITIVTPERRFLLACETESEQRAWMEAFRKVVDRPMLPQEYAGECGWGGRGGGTQCFLRGHDTAAHLSFSSGSPLQA